VRCGRAPEPITPRGVPGGEDPVDDDSDRSVQIVCCSVSGRRPLDSGVETPAAQQLQASRADRLRAQRSIQTLASNRTRVERIDFDAPLVPTIKPRSIAEFVRRWARTARSEQCDHATIPSKRSGPGDGNFAHGYRNCCATRSVVLVECRC